MNDTKSVTAAASRPSSFCPRSDERSRLVHKPLHRLPEPMVSLMPNASSYGTNHETTPLPTAGTPEPNVAIDDTLEGHVVYQDLRNNCITKWCILKRSQVLSIFMILKVFLAVCDLVYTPNRLQTSLAISLLSHGSSTPWKDGKWRSEEARFKGESVYDVWERTGNHSSHNPQVLLWCICQKFQLGASRNDSLQMTYSMFSDEYEGERLRVIVGHNSAAAEFAKMN